MTAPTLTREQKIRVAIAWMRRSHAAHIRGERDDDTAAGERAYQKWRKRVQRVTSKPQASRS